MVSVGVRVVVIAIIRLQLITTATPIKEILGRAMAQYSPPVATPMLTSNNVAFLLHIHACAYRPYWVLISESNYCITASTHTHNLDVKMATTRSKEKTNKRPLWLLELVCVAKNASNSK